LAAQAGEIESIHPLPDGPWIFSRAVLSSSPARSSVPTLFEQAQLVERNSLVRGLWLLGK
jgi:hypothetical protein